jgi:hypothetical protein
LKNAIFTVTRLLKHQADFDDLGFVFLAVRLNIPTSSPLTNSLLGITLDDIPLVVPDNIFTDEEHAAWEVGNANLP